MLKELPAKSFTLILKIIHTDVHGKSHILLTLPIYDYSWSHRQVWIKQSVNEVKCKWIKDSQKKELVEWEVQMGSTFKTEPCLFKL